MTWIPRKSDIFYCGCRKTSKTYVKEEREIFHSKLILVDKIWFGNVIMFDVKHYAYKSIRKGGTEEG
jgi:hypothetical protein